jgi:hypothetical protein
LPNQGQPTYKGGILGRIEFASAARDGAERWEDLMAIRAAGLVLAFLAVLAFAAPAARWASADDLGLPPGGAQTAPERIEGIVGGVVEPVPVPDDGTARRLSDDLTPGTVLWTKTIPSTGPATTGYPGVASPDEVPMPVAPPVGDYAPPAGTVWYYPDEPPVEPPLEPMPLDEPPVLDAVPAPPPPAAEAPVFQRSIVAPATREVDCDPPCAQRRDDCCFPLDWCGKRYGRWEIDLQATFGLMNDPQGPLGEPIFAGGAPGYDWGAIDHDWEFGARGALRYAVAGQRWLEARGGYYGKWNGTSNQVGRRFGFLPQAPFVSGVSNAVLTTEAELMGAELNFISEFACTGCIRFDFVFGGRWLDFKDTARASFAPNAGVGLFGPGFVNSVAENTLLAGQAGVVAHWDVSDRFELNAGIKAILGNLNRKATVTDQNIFVGGPHRAVSEEDDIVFGTDIEVGFKWRWTTWLAFTAGYNMLFVDDVLRGNTAMDFTKSTSGAVQARQELDQLIVHSVFAGFNINL